MKAITILQPWASLIACGAKQYETRSWKTNYRGPIAIHAGLKEPHYNYYPQPQMTAIVMAETLIKSGVFNLKTNRACDIFCSLPRGVIVAVADLVDCMEVICPVLDYKQPVTAAELQAGVMVSGKEYMFGDYSKGRYAWKLENIQVLKTPIPAKGKQGLWNFNYDDTQE